MTNKSQYFRIWLLLFIAIASMATAQSENSPKNIIFMIGDGMGVAHITAAKLVKGSLAMERCKIMGMHVTCSANNYVTDSAAAGTALATGYKTNNGMLGLDPEGKTLKNLMEYAREAGKATGVTVTAIIPHATPAAFVAHHTARYHYDIVSEQMANSDLDIMIGGGWDNFYPKTFTGSRRRDDRNLMLEMRQKMPVVTTYEALKNAGRVRQITAVLAPGHLPHASKRDYTLGDLTEITLGILNKNDKGFVVMIEGSQIDLAAHANDMQRILDETFDFDCAVKVALDFAEADGNTLVVITADHETGGLTFPYNSIENGKIVDPKFSSDNHTASMVPVFAYGPGAEKFGGMYDITHIARTMIELVKADGQPTN